jgi:hypothetical protein
MIIFKRFLVCVFGHRLFQMLGTSSGLCRPSIGAAAGLFRQLWSPSHGSSPLIVPEISYSILFFENPKASNR